MQGCTFLSTLSLLRATEAAKEELENLPISIHALLAESDSYPRCAAIAIHISIHALLAESDSTGVVSQDLIHISIHALLAESDNWPSV